MQLLRLVIGEFSRALNNLDISLEFSLVHRTVCSCRDWLELLLWNWFFSRHLITSLMQRPSYYKQVGYSDDVTSVYTQ